MFANNIPADSDEQTMLDEGKRMGLEPEDLTGESEQERSVNTPNPFDLSSDSKKPNEISAAAPEAKEEPEKKSEDDEEEEDQKPEKKPEEQKKDEKSEEDEGDDEKSPEANKAITRGEFGKFTRGLKSQFKELADAIANSNKATTPEKKVEAAAEVTKQVDLIEEYAKTVVDEKGRPLDAEGLKGLYKVFEKMLLEKIPLDQLNKLKDVTPVIENLSQSIKKDEAVTEFNNKYEDIQPTLAKQYPNATPEQWKKAKTLLKDFATGEQYKAYPLAHIVAIESEKIKDVLFSPKRKTAETGQLGEGADESTSDDLGSTRYEDMNPKKAAAIMEVLNSDEEYS